MLVTLVLAHVHYLMGNKKESLQYLRRFLKNSKGMQANVLLYPYLMEICWAMEKGELPSMSGSFA